jgi:acetylornithine deacetylase
VQAYVDEVALPRMRRFVAGPDIQTRMEVDVPGLAAEAESPAATLALLLSRSNRTIAVSYATEAGHFQRAGLPTVVCGPGSIDQAHKPDEFLSTDQLAQCLGFLGRLAEEASAER